VCTWRTRFLAFFERQCGEALQVGLARTTYIRYFWQGDHQIYGHIRCTHTVLANPTYKWQLVYSHSWQSGGPLILINVTS